MGNFVNSYISLKSLYKKDQSRSTLNKITRTNTHNTQITIHINKRGERRGEERRGEELCFLLSFLSLSFSFSVGILGKYCCDQMFSSRLVNFYIYIYVHMFIYGLCMYGLMIDWVDFSVFGDLNWDVQIC